MSERTELGVLNHLLEICRDGAHGFAWAAQHTTDPDVRDLFQTLAEERAWLVDELVPHVHRLGGQALGEGTAAGAVHRVWMALKNSLTRHHDDRLLAEAERGERLAMHAFQEALNGMLPPTVSDLIAAQYATITLAHDRIVALDNARNAGV
jgi:uncharacterized protein (TIGR02284 family)